MVRAFEPRRATALGVVEIGELTCHWFEARTLAGVFQPPGGRRSAAWGYVVQAARELLYAGEWRPTANMPTPPLRGELEQQTEPLLQLGSTLGEGANGVVVEAEAGVAGARQAEASTSSRLAVKMFRAQGGQTGMGTSVAGDGRVGMEAVMWEVHVLRQLRGHENIVRLP